MTERLPFHFSLSCIGEGNGNPLQCSCLENPRDGGAWWASVYGVAQSRTWLKRLSSSSSTHLSRNLFVRKDIYAYITTLFYLNLQTFFAGVSVCVYLEWGAVTSLSDQTQGLLTCVFFSLKMPIFPCLFYLFIFSEWRKIYLFYVIRNVSYSPWRQNKKSMDAFQF